MECYNSYGKPKIKYKTMDEAIAVAKKVNLDPKRIHKAVAYKCKICLRFHIGSNGRILQHKDNLWIG